MNVTSILRCQRSLGIGLLLLLGTTVRADVIVVDAAGGPGSDFTDLPAAVAAAVAGDILLVSVGTYSGFTLDKGLTITPEDGKHLALTGSIVVENLPSGSTATIVGVRPVFDNPPGEYDEMRLELRSNAGSVFVRDSIFRSLTAQTAAVSAEPGNVLSFMDCAVVRAIKLLKPGPSMLLQGSEVFLHRCAVVGARGKDVSQAMAGVFNPGGPGGDAITVVGSRLLLGLCTVVGGVGGDGGNSPCRDGGPGGNGLVVKGPTSRVVVRQSIISGGPGGVTSGPCTAGAFGLAQDVEAGEVTNAPGAARILQVESPVREHDTFQFQVLGQPGDQSYLAISFGTAPVFVPGGQLLLVNTPPLKIFYIGPFPASQSNQMTAPFVPAALDGYAVQAQALVVDGNSQLRSTNAHEIVLLSDVF